MSERRLRGIVLAVALLLPVTAAAHHGWSSFDQERPLYLAGTVESVQWENPHVELTIRPAVPLVLPADLRDRAMPAQEQPVDAQAILAKTAAVADYDGSWTVELAPLPRMQAWGVAPIEPGRVVELIGYGFPAERAARVMRVEFLLIEGRAYGLRSMPRR